MPSCWLLYTDNEHMNSVQDWPNGAEWWSLVGCYLVGIHLSSVGNCVFSTCFLYLVSLLNSPNIALRSLAQVHTHQCFATLKDLVAKLIGKDLVTLINFNHTSPNHCVSMLVFSEIFQGTVVPLIFEEKLELGKMGTDPGVQVELSYLQYWMDSSVTVAPMLITNTSGDPALYSATIFLKWHIAQASCSW